MTRGLQDNPRLAPIRSRNHGSAGASAPAERPLVRHHFPASGHASGRLCAVHLHPAAPPRRGTGIP